MALNEQTDVAPDADPAVSDKPPVEEREPSPEPSAPARIVINPKVFKDKRDGLCVAYNEAFRVIMEMNGFDPQAEPTEEQRKFFSDTAYADDERMLRRTILARICTFDDSVKNPTDEQLDEALEFLETVMEIGAPQSEEEQANVQRIHDMIAEIRKAPRPEEQPAEQPVESEAPPVAAVGGGYSSSEERWAHRRADVGTMVRRDENGRLPGSTLGKPAENTAPAQAEEPPAGDVAEASDEAKALGDDLKENLELANPKDKAFGGETFPGDPAAPLSADEDGGEDEIPGLAGDAPMAQAAAPAEQPEDTGPDWGRNPDGSLKQGGMQRRDENGRLIRGDIGGGKARGGKATDDTYVTNTAVVMPEDKARDMGAVTQDLEHVGKDQVSIPFDLFRMNGSTVDADRLLAESYGSAEAAEAAKKAAMEARAKRYSSVPSEAAMADPESVPVVPADTRPGPWDEAYLSHAARAGHWNLKTVKSGEYLRTAGYIPGLSLGLIPTRVLGTSSPSIEVRRMLNSRVGETGESMGNGRIVTISDTANPNKPGWYASDEGYRAAALGSVKGWLTANERMPGEGEDLAAVMAAAHRDRSGLKRGRIYKNGKDFLAAVAKAYEAERGGSASKKDKEILAAARDMDMWGQVVGARRYDRYSTTA